MKGILTILQKMAQNLPLKKSHIEMNFKLLRYPKMVFSWTNWMKKIPISSRVVWNRTLQSCLSLRMVIVWRTWKIYLSASVKTTLKLKKSWIRFRTCMKSTKIWLPSPFPDRLALDVSNNFNIETHLKHLPQWNWFSHECQWRIFLFLEIGSFFMFKTHQMLI